LPAVPQTLEGWSVLHQMFRFRWTAWQKAPHQQTDQIVREASDVLGGLERDGLSGVYSLLGHKGDLLFIHYRNSFDELKQVELGIARLGLGEFLEPTSSFLSVVELGLYDSTVKLYRELAAKGLEAHSPEWQQAVEQTLARQREAMRPRLYPKIPATRYVCFYPMDRKRGEDRNFYTLPIEERQKQMEAHGMVGRRYAGKVQQVISGAIGFDDWEWGVDLYSEDPLVFKKLIYEMRFDQVSAVYALFGQFYVGLRVPSARLGELLSGQLPGKE
jgi:chlorite dismutase